MRYVAAVPAVGVLGGAACGLLAPDLARFCGGTLIVAGLLLAAVAWRREWPAVLAAAISGVFFAGGARLAADAWARAWRPPLRSAFEALARVERDEAAAEGRRLPEEDEAGGVVAGELRADASPGENGVGISVDVDRIGDRATSGGIVATVVGAIATDRLGEWRAGRRVRMPIRLRRPSRYLDPGVADNERALARRGVTLVGTVKSGALVEILARGGALAEAMAAARAFSRRAIADAVGRWSPRSAAIVAAIVIGDRAGLDVDVQRKLQEAGTYHVIAISGGNIAILAGLLLGAFRVAGWLGRGAMLAAVALLALYADLVGGGASVDRATLMAAVYFGARAMDLESSPLNALAVVAALLVAADPLAIVDPAFVLTFGATFAILLIVPIVAARTRAATGKAAPRRPAAALVHVATQMFAASAATEALLFPVGALVFSRVTFAGLALNFAAIPLMAVAQVAGMAVVPIAIVTGRAAALAGWVAHAGAEGLVRSADLVRFAPMLTWRLAPPSAFVVVAYYVAAGTWSALSWRRVHVTGSAESSGARRLRRAAAPIAGAAALWILVDPHAFVAARGDGRLRVAVLDVGQGDSIFVVFPRGATLLIDAGGLSASSAFDIGDRVVAPVVRDAGFRRIDYFALTHGDPDHIGGAAAIVREFRPREIWEGIPVPRLEALTRLRMQAQAAGARWANVYAGSRIVVDGVEVVARHPPPADWERQRVRNDDSLVLELRWRDVSFVLTGDIGRAPERAIASAFPPARLRIVKIPHHGSLTSSTAEFVAALHPQVAIASAGRSNHFGHPVPEVLDRYRSAGAQVFRTDQDGAVTVATDGYGLTVHTFNGRDVDVPRRHEDTK